MVKEDTGVGIDVGPGVLDLTQFHKNGRNNVVDSLAKINERIVLDVSGGEVSEMGVSGVSMSQDSMSVSWNDLTFSQSSVSEFSDLSLTNIVSEFFLKVKQPSQDFLISETVEGTSQTIKTSGVREIRISQSRTNQVSGVGRDITTFVVTVNGQISSNALLHFVLLVSQHVSIVTGPIKIRISLDDLSSLKL